MAGWWRDITKVLLMRIRQWNVGRGMEATREACVRAQREKVEVLLLQEPYVSWKDAGNGR